MSIATSQRVAQALIVVVGISLFLGYVIGWGFAEYRFANHALETESVNTIPVAEPLVETPTSQIEPGGLTFEAPVAELE